MRSPWVTATSPELDVALYVVRGPQCRLFLVMKPQPVDLSHVVIRWPDREPLVVGATNFVNGVVEAPSILDEWRAASYQVFSNGGKMGQTWGMACWDAPLFEERPSPDACFAGFADTRRHLKENLRFLLRAATTERAFSYAADEIKGLPFGESFPGGIWTPEGWFGRPPGSTDYEYSGFRVFSANLNFSVMQELRPVHENHLWRSFMVNADNLAATNFPSGPGTDFDGTSFIRVLDYPTNYYAGTGEEQPLPVPLINTEPSFLFYRSVQWPSWGYDAAQEIGVYSTAGGFLSLWQLMCETSSACPCNRWFLAGPSN